jgi:hypothetical protein
MAHILPISAFRPRIILCQSCIKKRNGVYRCLHVVRNIGILCSTCWCRGGTAAVGHLLLLYACSCVAYKDLADHTYRNRLCPRAGKIGSSKHEPSC